MIAGAANDLKVQLFPVQAGVIPVEQLTQLIFKLMVTSSCRDTVCGECIAVQQPFKSPFVCIVEVL